MRRMLGLHALYIQRRLTVVAAIAAEIIIRLARRATWAVRSGAAITVIFTTTCRLARRCTRCSEVLDSALSPALVLPAAMPTRVLIP